MDFEVGVLELLKDVGTKVSQILLAGD